MGNLFQEIFYQPLFNGLIALYQSIAFRDLGVAIILLTVVVRLILYPLFHQTAKHQRLTQQLQPELKKIRDNHKSNREAQTRAVLELYKKHRVNPLTPFILLLAQLPVLFALYYIFVSDLSQGLGNLLYSFVPHPGSLNQTFLGLVNLRHPSGLIAVFAALAQYFQGKLAFAKSAPNQSSELAQAGKFMIFVGPAVALIVLFRLPAAVGLYWLTSTFFSIIQQVVVNKSVNIAR